MIYAGIRIVFSATKPYNVYKVLAIKNKRGFEITKMKRKNLLLLFALALILFTGAEQKRENILLAEAVEQEQPFQLVSVGPADEVAIGFKYGVVYLYDKEGGFLCRYDFQVNSGAGYAVFFNSDSTVDCYKSRSKKVYKYNRNGDFIEERLVTDIDAIDIIRKMRNVDSRGVRYEAKKGNLVKIYPDGKEEIFCPLNSEENNLVFIEIGLGAVALILFVIGKNISLKKNFPHKTEGPPEP